MQGQDISTMEISLFIIHLNHWQVNRRVNLFVLMSNPPGQNAYVCYAYVLVLMPRVVGCTVAKVVALNFFVYHGSPLHWPSCSVNTVTNRDHLV